MAARVNNYLLDLPKELSVSVNLTSESGQQIKKAGTLFVSNPPELEIRFSSGAFSGFEPIDRESDCLVLIEEGELVTLICTIVEDLEDCCLKVTARELKQMKDRRHYFRTCAERVKVRYCQEAEDGREECVTFLARGVDISCEGMLMETNQKVSENQQLAIQMRMPEPIHKNISCKATVIRVSRKKNSYFVAVRFDDLDDNHCDDIVCFCFAEQRKRLRENVATKDIN